MWASIEKTPEQVISDALAEASHRDPSGDKIWVALVDGNKTQIRILNKLARKNDLNLTIIVDIIQKKRGTFLNNSTTHRLWASLLFLRGSFLKP